MDIQVLGEHSGAASITGRVSPLISCGVIDSTNQEAHRRLREAADQTIILARSQTAGRGRYGRWWYSPKGNLYCSIIVHAPPGNATDGNRSRSQFERWGEVSLLTALAVRKSLAPLLPSPESCLLKWPNDVLIAGRKVAGILLESATSGDVQPDPGTSGTWRLIIGIGVNLRHFPDDISATSMWHEGAGIIEPRAFLTRMIPYWQELYQHWRKYGFAAIRCQWLACGYALGEVMRVCQGAKCVLGRLITLDSGGALILEPVTEPQVTEPRVAPPQVAPPQGTSPLIVPDWLPKIADTTKLLVRITSGELFFPRQTIEFRCCSR